MEDKELTMVRRRNDRIRILFENLGYEFKVLGNIHKPVVIVGDGLMLSLYIQNFYLHVLDEPKPNGKVIHTIKLNFQSINDMDLLMELRSHLIKSKHKLCYKLKLANTDPAYYLAGYNKLNVGPNEIQYPVMSNQGYKIYFDKDKAESVRDGKVLTEYSAKYPHVKFEVVQCEGHDLNDYVLPTSN